MAIDSAATGEHRTLDGRADEVAPRWLLIALGAIGGLLAVGLALGAAELVAALDRAWRSPVLDVGDRVVDNVPPAVKDLAIEWFGTNDKVALLVGIGVLLGLVAIGLGIATATRGPSVALVGVAAFAIVGCWAALSRRTSTSFGVVLPALTGAVVAGAALVALHRAVRTTGEDDASGAVPPLHADELHGGAPLGTTSSAEPPLHADELRSAPPSGTSGGGATRRDVLRRAGATLGSMALLAVATGSAGRALRSRFSAERSRSELTLPSPDRALPPIGDGVRVDVPGMQPFITPNDDFYRIDTALTIPQVPVDSWALRIHGLVDEPYELTFDELLDRGVDEYDITLSCVSNTVGGELVGNVRWLGVRLDDLLDDARVRPDADQVVGRSVDGYTCGFPLEAATDGRNAIVAVGMNGEPLPLAHGFPARLVVPGLYGYVSATKWLREIELTRFDSFDQYWVPRGYAERAPIKLMSRIDSIDGLGTLAPAPDGTAAIGGVAWAQTRGISAVEVQVDDGPWQPAELGDALSDDTWRQWSYRWSADEGRTSVRCRATDGDGVIQTAERSEPLPNGASGHHEIVIFVE